MAVIKLGSTKIGNGLMNYCYEKAMVKSGINCDPEYAKKQFQVTREIHGKNTGIQVHSITQSFKPGELTSKKANEIGIELAEKVAKGHEVVIYTHTDREHIHNHIVINAVNYENGKKYQSNKKDLYIIREQSDKICKEHNLSVIQEPNAKIRYTLAEKSIIEQGKISWKDELRQVIDLEKSQSKGYNDLKLNLKEKYGIEVNERGKNITFKHPDNGLKVRGKTLGLSYERGTLENEFSREIERGKNITKTENRINTTVGRNNEIKRVNEELYISSNGQEYNKPNDNTKRIINDTEHKHRDTKQDDFNIKEAERNIKQLQRETTRAFTGIKKGDTGEQQKDIRENIGDRKDVTQRNELYNRNQQQTNGPYRNKSIEFDRKH